MCGDVEDLQLGKFRGEGGFCDVFSSKVMRVSV